MIIHDLELNEVNTNVPETGEDVLRRFNLSHSAVAAGFVLPPIQPTTVTTTSFTPGALSRPRIDSRICLNIGVRT
jgi:hypothetical protein